MPLKRVVASVHHAFEKTLLSDGRLTGLSSHVTKRWTPSVPRFIQSVYVPINHNTGSLGDNGSS